VELLPEPDTKKLLNWQKDIAVDQKIALNLLSKELKRRCSMLTGIEETRREILGRYGFKGLMLL
jgi:hypothetical protein